MEKKRISPFYWKKWLAITLEKALPAERNKAPLAFVGIGNPLNGDDAAGIVALQWLRKELRRLGAKEEGVSGDASSFFHGRIVLIEASQAPENFTGLLRRISPQIVFLIDAAWMDCASGTICMIPWQEMSGFTASTHIQPPSMFARYIIEQTGCEVFTLGIQPASLNFDSPLSPPVQRAVKRLVRELSRLLFKE